MESPLLRSRWRCGILNLPSMDTDCRSTSEAEDARKIDPVNQLVIYALAFAPRARLPLKTFKCA